MAGWLEREQQNAIAYLQAENIILNEHWGAITASELFTVEVMTLRWLVRYRVLFTIDLKTRMVVVAGIVHNPHGEWVKNVFRELTNPVDGFATRSNSFNC